MSAPPSSLRSPSMPGPNPSTQLGWKDCAVLLHSPKAERHSFTNQSPLSSTAHHPQSGATFRRAAWGIILFLPIPSSRSQQESEWTGKFGDLNKTPRRRHEEHSKKLVITGGSVLSPPHSRAFLPSHQHRRLVVFHPVFVFALTPRRPPELTNRSSNRQP